jgi:hypothetical protein
VKSALKFPDENRHPLVAACHNCRQNSEEESYLLPEKHNYQTKFGGSENTI